MWIKKILCVFLAGSFFMIGCASPYVGKPMPQFTDGVCSSESFPHICHRGTSHLDIDYSIIRGDSPGEYVLSGTIKWIGDDTRMIWAKSGQGSLELLIGDDVVLDRFYFGIHFEVGKPTKFRRTFKTDYKFTNSIMGYTVRVRD